MEPDYDAPYVDGPPRDMHGNPIDDDYPHAEMDGDMGPMGEQGPSQMPAGPNPLDMQLARVHKELEELAGENTDYFYQWRNDLFSRKLDYTNYDEVQSWLKGLKSRYGLHWEGSRACIENGYLYRSVHNPLPHHGDQLNGCEMCNRWVGLIQGQGHSQDVRVN